jgi:hypothetical protein
MDCSEVEITVDGPWKCLNVVQEGIPPLGTLKSSRKDELLGASVLSAVPCNAETGDVVLDDVTSDAIDESKSSGIRTLLSDPLGFVVDVNSSVLYS